MYVYVFAKWLSNGNSNLIYKFPVDIYEIGYTKSTLFYMAIHNESIII